MTSLILLLLSLTFSATSTAPLKTIEPASFERSASSFFQLQENELSNVRRLDREDRANGQFMQLTPTEHIRRGFVYLANRAFAEAREHFQAIIEHYPNDGNIPTALLGAGRSYFQDHRYEESIPLFERLSREYAQTKEGREGLYSLASAFLRIGRADEAAARYREYAERYPNGERIELAYLNVIDSFREAGHPKDAIQWITITRERFSGTPTGTNALFARLRLDVSESDWKHAIQTADELRNTASFRGKVMTSLDEVTYLKAYSMERAGRKEEAISTYLMIPDRPDSYYGWLATMKVIAFNDAARRADATAREGGVNAQINAAASQYPAPYRETILREATRRGIDPRLVLAIMRQESGFRPRAKSPAAARGLLQLTIETATKYAAHVGLNNLHDEDLYRPETSILLGSEYIAELSRMFPDQPEAVVASYNGGEDNVARWIKRARQHDAGVFTAEVGFDETKAYVNKVMANYRAYKQLYTADLRRR